MGNGPGQDTHPTAATLQFHNMYGSPIVAEAAGAARTSPHTHRAKSRWGKLDNNLHAGEAAYDEVEANLLHRLREDLQIPGGRLTIVP